MKYEAKVKYTKLNEISGKEQVVSEIYIVNDAETFSDAEYQTFKYMAERTPSTIMAAIKISDIEDVSSGIGDWYYKARIASTSIDEISGKEKQTISVLLVQSDDFSDSLDLCNTWVGGSMLDSEVVSITKTKIVDII